MSKSLSILLPTYNCICTALVGELQRQCVAEGADFEIIVADDASPDKRFIAENRAIARLDGVRYIERERNVGNPQLSCLAIVERMDFIHRRRSFAQQCPIHTQLSASRRRCRSGRNQHC